MQNEAPVSEKANSPSRTSKSWLLAVVIVVVSMVALLFYVRKSYLTPDFMQQASSALKRGDEAAAVSAFRSEIQRHPDSTAAKLRLAKLLQDSSPDEAIEYLQQIPVSDPQRSNAVQQIAVLCILHNKTSEAETALLELMEKSPGSLGPQLSLAELHYQNQKPEAALPFADKAASIAPDRAQTFLLLAEIHDEMLHPEKMIEPLQQAIRLEPDFYEAHLNLAYAYNKTGQPAMAEEQARWCLRINPREVAALRILALAARDQGDFEAAKQHLKTASQIEPLNLDCRILEADLLLFERKPQEAYERLRELYDSHQQTVRYLGALARAAASAGKRDEARELHRRVAELLKQAQ
jgi:tetratricopeptide (TPR) repeat protein